MWILAAKRDLKKMPDEVQDDFGFGLYQAEKGEYPNSAKTLSGFGSANVIELKNHHNGDAFRAVYTVQFEDVIFVLHAFQKKSKKDSETPKQEIDLIKSRLKIAEQMYKEMKDKRGKNG